MSTIKIETVKLQEVMQKVIRGAGRNKLIPISNLVEIRSENKQLIFTTTDGSNTLKVFYNQDKELPTFQAVVDVELLNKLIQKMTAKETAISIDTSLNIKGNGNYKLELIVDEDGNVIRFPEYEFDYDVEKQVINKKALLKAIEANSVSVAETFEMPCLTGYYISDFILTSNGYKSCMSNLKIVDEPLLLPSRLIDLISVFSDNEIYFQTNSESVLFSGENECLFGFILDGIEDFPIEQLSKLFETNVFNISVEVDKQELLNTLDRISLFVSPWENNSIRLFFTKVGLDIESKQSTGMEFIEYSKVNSLEEKQTININSEFLKSVVSSIPEKTIKISFADGMPIIHLSSDSDDFKINNIIALQGD